MKESWCASLSCRQLLAFRCMFLAAAVAAFRPVSISVARKNLLPRIITAKSCDISSCRPREWGRSVVTLSMSSTGDNDDDSNDLPLSKQEQQLSSDAPEDDQDSTALPLKVHHVTVCMVPPPQAEKVWKTIGEMRLQLKDPGYYRWPPHSNLLYPFLEVKSSDHQLPEILNQLLSATSQVEPFRVCLNRLGTFGGKQRGVLWLSPESLALEENGTAGNDDTPPLIDLHKKLETAFPMCRDQTKGGSFTPHMTLSHFVNLDGALEAQAEIERDFGDQLPQLDFVLDRIYLLRRQGDGGQFLRMAEIGLGAKGVMEQFDPPRSFPDMPLTEEDWVYQERMKLKQRRNYSGRGRTRRGGSKRSIQRPREPRIPDPPEVIEAKRAERKAKRERLEREQQQQQERNEN